MRISKWLLFYFPALANTPGLELKRDHRGTQKHKDKTTRRHRRTTAQKHREQGRRGTETQRREDTQRHRDTVTLRHRHAHTHAHTKAPVSQSASQPISQPASGLGSQSLLRCARLLKEASTHNLIRSFLCFPSQVATAHFRWVPISNLRFEMGTLDQECPM